MQSDPIGLAGGWNYNAYAGEDPINFKDPMGLDWYNRGEWDIPVSVLTLQNISNYSAGFGDTFSFGFSGWTRDNYAVVGTSSIDKCWQLYIWGGRSENALEIVTLGIPSCLKALAKRRAARYGTQAVVRTKEASSAVGAFRSAKASKGAIVEGKFVHHMNPLFGHPKGLFRTGFLTWTSGRVGTLFPSAGLPAWLHSSKMNLQLIPAAKHAWTHRFHHILELIGLSFVHPATTAGRTAYMESQSECDGK